MIKKLFFLFAVSANAQSLHHQSIGSLGNTIITSKGIRVSQTIGQQSVVGSATYNGFIVQQGFQQSIFFKSSVSRSTINVITKVFPNPFISTLNFEFSSEVKGEVEVSLFDSLGRLVYNSNFVPQQNRITVSALTNLTNGNYFVSLTALNFKYSTQLIKLNQ